MERSQSQTGEVALDQPYALLRAIATTSDNPPKSISRGGGSGVLVTALWLRTPLSRGTSSPPMVQSASIARIIGGDDVHLDNVAADGPVRVDRQDLEVG